MEKKAFKKILFKAAFCTMACDGHIDPKEIDELKAINKGTSYFRGVDLSQELHTLVQEVNQTGIKAIKKLFENLKNLDLNSLQELLILEVVLRIIYADKIIDENEIKFLNLIRSYLKIHDEEIYERFGKIEILHMNEYLEEININIIEKLKLPNKDNLESIKIEISKN
jgi:uncharacterized tellurite resistance protein B-like protein